jgi:hypothetical protein
MTTEQINDLQQLRTSWLLEGETHAGRSLQQLEAARILTRRLDELICILAHIPK